MKRREEKKGHARKKNESSPRETGRRMHLAAVRVDEACRMREEEDGANERRGRRRDRRKKKRERRRHALTTLPYRLLPSLLQPSSK